MVIKDILNKLNISNNSSGWGTIKIKFPLLRKIKKALKENRKINILLIDTPDLYTIAGKSGWRVANNIAQSFQKLLYHNARLYLYPANIITIQKFSADIFLLYISHKTDIDSFDLQKKIRDFKESLTDKIKRDINLIYEDFTINIGLSILDTKNSDELEKAIFNSIKHSFQSATLEYDYEKEKHTALLVKAIADKQFSSLYQPLVSLKSPKIFGYEALSRGPQDSFLYYPDNLFPFAEEAGLLLQLERVTRELAISNFHCTIPNTKLFINLNPIIINDPSFASGETLNLIKSLGLLPQNIVFEITERTAIKDFDSFKKTILHYRDQGFMIAIDDAGAGYSSLQSIAELAPDFIKIDKSLISDIDKDIVKKSLLETFLTFADKINSKIIAEGIETEQEMKTLLAMGVMYGQGYYLARPGNPLPLIENKAWQLLQSFQGRQDDLVVDNYIPLGDIIQEVMCLRKDSPTKDVVNYFKQNEHAKAAVVLDNAQPIGLIMRDKLFQQLGTQYGVALYWGKPVSLVMDANPLTVEAHQPLLLVSELAANRNSKKLYDDILVTEDHKFIGIVPVQKLLNHLHR